MKTMKTGKKRALKIMLMILAALAVLLLTVYINHRIRLKREEPLLTPLGSIVNVEGESLSVYNEGEGEKTLLFMSGSGTCSPILDFKSLYSLLSDDYKIAVIEKNGYGFSGISDRSRDIDTVLSDTRAALSAAGLEAPYVLCPHSMSGIEALYWAQKYPEEIEAIIGLDMAVPGYYEKMKISVPVLRLGQLGAGLGVTRLIPGLADGDAVKYGTLTDKEKEIYRALFYSRTASEPMIREAMTIKDSAKKVAAGDRPDIRSLLFISDGSGGTGFSEADWRRIPREYFGGADSIFIELDCPHYVHDHEYERIAGEIKKFLEDKSED